jgi:hypothetical protein
MNWPKSKNTCCRVSAVITKPDNTKEEERVARPVQDTYHTGQPARQRIYTDHATAHTECIELSNMDYDFLYDSRNTCWPSVIILKNRKKTTAITTCWHQKQGLPLLLPLHRENCRRKAGLH